LSRREELEELIEDCRATDVLLTQDRVNTENKRWELESKIEELKDELEEVNESMRDLDEAITNNICDLKYYEKELNELPDGVTL